MIWVILWYLSGIIIMIYFILDDGDVTVKDLPWIFGLAFLGPVMVALLYQEGIIKLPKLPKLPKFLDKDRVLIKKKNK